MKIIYFDVFAGISGDMCLGALVDAGCPGEALRSTLRQLNLPGFDMNWSKVRRGALSGTKVDIIVEEEPHAHRSLGDVLSIVDRIEWPGRVRERIETAFTFLAKAEGLIHDRPYDAIHFHEVGSYDAILDISGSLLAIHLMEIERFACSRIHLGTGIIEGTRHGRIPAPAPASSDLLKGFEVYSIGLPYEMVTPTGAAILRALVDGSSPLPAMRLDAIGYGAGSRESKEMPNLLRVMIGEESGAGMDRVTVVEANIDDMNPEFYEPLMERLFAAGALDVSLIPAQMKKSRPGVLLSVIAKPGDKERVAQLILRESSTIGVRMRECERRILRRESLVVETPFGTVRGKVCWGHGVEKRFTPEYEDCKRIAAERQASPTSVYHEAIIAYNRDRQTGAGNQA